MIYWTGASVIKEKFPSKQRTFQWNRCFSGSDSVAEHVLHGGTRVGHKTIVVYRLHIIRSCIRQKFRSATGEQKYSEKDFNEKFYSQPINHEKKIIDCLPVAGEAAAAEEEAPGVVSGAAAAAAAAAGAAGVVSVVAPPPPAEEAPGPLSSPSPLAVAEATTEAGGDTSSLAGSEASLSFKCLAPDFAPSFKSVPSSPRNSSCSKLCCA